MTVLAAEQAVVTIVVTRGDESSYTTRITDGEVATDDAARHQHARRPYLFRLIGQKPCTCPKTYRLMSQSYRVGEKARPFVQDITDPQRDCPRCGHYPDAAAR